MKKLITLVLIASFFQAHSQLSAGMHTGVSERKLLAGLHFQYQFRNGFTTGVNMTTFAGDSYPVFFQSRLGYTFGNSKTGISVQPYTGYSYSVQSIDKGNYGGHITAGMQFRHQLTRIAILYSDVNIPAPNYCLFTIGLAGKLPL